MSEIQVNSEINCSNCVAACCRAGAALALNEIERQRHRKAMSVQVILKPKPNPQITKQLVNAVGVDGRTTTGVIDIEVPQHYGFYFLTKKCGNLAADNTCTRYDERPDACKQFEVGSDVCLSARAAYGLDGYQATRELDPAEPTKTVTRAQMRRIDLGIDLLNRAAGTKIYD